MFEQTIDIERIEQIVNLFGNFDENIKRIEKRYGVAITSHGSTIRVKGEVDGVVSACRTIEGLIRASRIPNVMLIMWLLWWMTAKRVK